MKRLFTLTMLLFATIVFAQEEGEKQAAKLSITGSVDAYWQTNLTAPDNEGVTFGTAFANQTGFAIGMANLIAAYEGEKAGVVIDLVTGPRGAGATFNTDIVDGIVNQAYVYWNVSESTTFTFGRWNTFLGYEVIAPAGNFNYSCSYLFSSGPFSHIGLKADFALSDDISLMLAVTNPWDTNNISMSGEYALGAQLGLYGQYINVYYDSGKNDGLGFEIDYTGGFDLSDSFYLGINAAYNDNDGEGFYGAALYPQVQTCESFAIGLRGEYFALHGDGDDLPSVFATTLTGSYETGNLIIKPEIRLDALTNADGGIFYDSTDPDSIPPIIDNDGMMADSLAAFTLAAIYTF